MEKGFTLIENYLQTQAEGGKKYCMGIKTLFFLSKGKCDRLKRNLQKFGKVRRQASAKKVPIKHLYLAVAQHN